MTRSTHDARPRAAWTPSSAKPPLASRLMRASWRGLPAARHQVGVERGLAVPAADGSPLVTDHYFPRAEGDFPTLLVRTPYGRGVPWSPQYGILFAEQGFHVVLQSCRGTGGSGGAFHLWRNEPADGLAAVGWLREQPWFDGRLGTVGPSYLGYVQWALALDPPPELKAMVVQVGLHDPYALFHTDGVLGLETALAVGAGMTHQHRGMGPFVRATLRLQRRVRSAVTARPLRGAYADALGGEIPWLDDVMAHPDADDPYWEGASLAGAAEGAADRAAVPVALITGWHDALVDQTFAQYDRLRRAGADASLLVGPWTHTSALQAGWSEVFTESLAWLRAHLCADPSGLRPTPVRVHVGGAQASVRDLDAWPPEASTASWYPTADGHLTREAPTDTAPVASFRHDPDDPVPTVGGALLSRSAGARDNASSEARADVLTFTGPALAGPLTVLGPVSARISAATDTGYGDVFVRLCDVDPEGRSVNVCDGLARLRSTGPDPVRVTVPMTPTAHRFAPGHRLRWQISPAPHPRYALNPGTGEPRIDATEFVPVRVTVHADSELTLPVGPTG
ncbi:CocE/NonD family hydrolase [Streptomyces sp. SID9727]|uniref:CocE/NonD family hydrolase n=1 Tax=Streptomyces sp. SID9727 TaxID=2706114 RepID=UPI0013CC6178|nr:CocE/NonD family hydrolase [Streptomyces sp. SID9727]NEC66938.1 CocE/NonD family hydrolase [Streptomyces sp. SID9727]